LGLQKLPFEPAIDMTPEDFSEVIQGVLHPETCAVTMDDFIKVLAVPVCWDFLNSGNEEGDFLKGGNEEGDS
jgi:hypothetical protein